MKQFSGPVRAEELRTAFHRGLDVMRDEGGCKWVSDNRYVEPYSQSDVEWIRDDWAARMVEAGWTYWALVEPLNIMSNINMGNFIVPFQKRGVIVEFFDTPDDALRWIQSL